MTWDALRETLKSEIEKPKEELLSVLSNGMETRTFIHFSDKLFDAVCAIPEVQQTFNTMFCVGGMGSLIQPHAFCEALITRALELSCNEAVDALMLCLRSDTTYNEVSLLGGLAVDEKIELCDGFYICPPEHVPIKEFQEQQKKVERLRFSHNKYEINDRRRISAALVRPGQTNRRFCRADEMVVADDSYAAQIVMLLVLVGPSSPIAYRYLQELDDSDFLKGFTSDGFGGNRDETRVAANILVSQEQFDGFSEVITAYRGLPENIRTHLSVSLHRLNESIRHQSDVDKALDLGIALESLLLNDNDREQLTLQFRLRGAWLLGNNGNHRAALSREFQEIYSLRSQAVHKGTLSTKKGTTPSEVIANGQRLCTEAIKRIILKGGFPNWNALLVGSDYCVELTL